MSLWCIFRSPLMMGGELRNNDDFTLSLLTNPEILRMHRQGEEAHQVRRSARSCVWQSRDWEDGSTYVALFNLRDTPGEVTVYFHELELLGKYAVRDLWAHKDLGEGGRRPHRHPARPRRRRLPPQVAQLRRINPPHTKREAAMAASLFCSLKTAAPGRQAAPTPAPAPRI